MNIQIGSVYLLRLAWYFGVFSQTPGSDASGGLLCVCDF